MRRGLSLGWDELAQENLAWDRAIQVLERATAVLDEASAQQAMRDGSDAARRVGELTGGRPDAVLQSRWVQALLGWQNRGSSVPALLGANGTIPMWVWIVLGIGAVVAMKGRGRLSWE